MTRNEDILNSVAASLEDEDGFEEEVSIRKEDPESISVVKLFL